MPRRSDIYIKCSIDGCSGSLVARGLCRKHYIRWHRKGTTELSVVTSEERFWRQVNKIGPVYKYGRCWAWTGATFRGGYGAFSLNKLQVKAHRYSWTLHYGPIPNGLRVLHKCDNPNCVNPHHLFLGTDIDNMIDRDTKGRQVKGEKVHTARLTEKDVVQIRAEYRYGSPIHGSTALARRYGVSYQTILRVLKYRIWKHV